MEIPIFLLLLGFFVFLFCLYAIAHDDFVFFRKNVTIERLFDVAFIGGLTAFLFARIFYIAFHFQPKYLSPLVFFLIPEHSGLSLGGALIGISFFIMYYGRKAKLPTGRVFDFFLISLLLPLAAIYEGYFFWLKGNKNIILFFLPLLFIIAYGVFHHVLQKVKLKDGSVAFLSMSTIISLSLIINVLLNIRSANLLQAELILQITLLFISVALLLINENLLPTFRKK